MNYKILGTHWYAPQVTDQCVGIVAIESNDNGEWKCYVGYGLGVDEHQDAHIIAAHGAPLYNAEAAAGFFPLLDPAKYVF